MAVGNEISTLGRCNNYAKAAKEHRLFIKAAKSPLFVQSKRLCDIPQTPKV